MRQSDTFQFEGLTLPYLPQQEGEHIGERRIEVPIARFWLMAMRQKFAVSQMIEVGAVLPYHSASVAFDVLDPFDPHVAVTHRMDAEDFDYTGRAVLSLSTIEHIGTKEYSATPDIFKARRVLRKIVQESSAFLVSLPIGFHPCLDAMLESSGGGDMRFMRQVSAENVWEACAPDWEARYGEPLPYANVVVFISNSFDFAEGQ